MLFKQPEHRKFDYTPLYYKREKDPENSRQERIRFPRSGARKNNNVVRKIIFFVLLALLAVYFLKKLAIFP